MGSKEATQLIPSVDEESQPHPIASNISLPMDFAPAKQPLTTLYLFNCILLILGSGMLPIAQLMPQFWMPFPQISNPTVDDHSKKNSSQF